MPSLWRSRDKPTCSRDRVITLARAPALLMKMVRGDARYRAKSLTQSKRAGALRSRRLEGERHAVHAIAQAGRLRSIVENVAQMALASMAGHGRAGHAPRMVGALSTALSKGAQKLGQPVPLSNFVEEENRSDPQPAQAKMPFRSSCRSGLVKGRSVPSLRRTAYCSGVRVERQSASVRTTCASSAASALGLHDA